MILAHDRTEINRKKVSVTSEPEPSPQNKFLAKTENLKAMPIVQGHTKIAFGKDCFETPPSSLEIPDISLSILRQYSLIFLFEWNTVQISPNLQICLRA